MPKILTASHATQVPDGGLAEWYHLLPSGVFNGRDGRGPYVLKTPETQVVLSAFNRLKCDLQIDYEHQSLDARDKSGPVPAAGWIKELAARDDGLWGRVEWTPVAANCLKNKEYRYVSPVFIHDKSGSVKAITGAALTNSPNLHLQAAASRSERLHSRISGEGGRLNDDLKERICALLGLDPATATDDEILEGVSALKGEFDSANSDGEADEPKEDENKDEEAAQKRGGYDPAKYVPMEMLVAVQSQLVKLQAEQSQAQAKKTQEKAVALVQSAMRAGKVPPALKDWAIAYASRDIEGFHAYIDGAPVIVPASHDGAVSRPGQGTQATGALSPEQKAVAVAMGIHPALYLKSLQEAQKEAE